MPDYSICHVLSTGPDRREEDTTSSLAVFLEVLRQDEREFLFHQDIYQDLF
jgi:hypothetical protein